MGKVPERRDVLMMCVSAGKSVREIAWRKCDWIKRTCCRMAEEEKFGYFRLSEETEGENGGVSSGCGCLEVLCGKSSAAIEVVGGGGVNPSQQ